MLKPYLDVFLVLLLPLAGCGPMVPLSYEPDCSKINLAQTIDSPEATVTVEYLKLQNGYFIFDLEVANHSSIAIHVDPQTISFYASPKLFPNVDNASADVHKVSFQHSALLVKRQFASSPIDIEKLYRERAKGKERASAFFAILGAGLMIYDGIKDAHDSYKEKWTRRDEKNAVSRDLLVSAAITASQVANQAVYTASEDSHYLPYEPFPDSYICSGDSVRGKVFVPAERSYRYSRLVVPLSNVDYVFDFKRRGAKSKKK